MPFRANDSVTQAPARAPDGLSTNRWVGWTSLTAGALTGLVLGLWSFDGPMSAPGGLASYDELSRRLARLGHIACFGLGILNVLLSRELPALMGESSLRRRAARSMNFGNVFLPLTLFAAAAYHPLKYLMPVPALAVTVALAITAWGAWQAGIGVTARR